MRENEWNCKVSKEREMNEVCTILTDLTQLKPWNFHYFQWILLRSGSQNFALQNSGMSIWSEMRENEWNCKVSKEREMNEVCTILTDLTQLKPWNFHYFQWISLRSGSQNFAWDCFLTTRRFCTENLRGIFCSLDTGPRRLAPTLSKLTIFALLSVRVKVPNRPGSISRPSGRVGQW